MCVYISMHIFTIDIILNSDISRETELTFNIQNAQKCINSHYIVGDRNSPRGKYFV